MLLFRRQLHNVLIASYRYYSVPKKIVLGIETSCDDTGAAIVNESGTVLGEYLASQMKIHLEYCSYVIYFFIKEICVILTCLDNLYLIQIFITITLCFQQRKHSLC